MTPARPASQPGSAYATFRPRRGVWVARISAVACVAVFTGLAVSTPSAGSAGWSVPDRVMTVVLGLVLGALIWRFAVLRAIPTPTGLRVVNLLRRHDLEWATIVNVGFSGGAPWVVLELADTEEVAVMAIQRADGTFAQKEASRLAALVSHHSRPPPRSES
ncbi:MAG: PH domain-containing protein [Ornithinimicrobium sp.]